MEVHGTEMRSDPRRDPVPVTACEALVREAYAAADQAVARRLERLGQEEGVEPSCRLHCSHCCRQFILMNVVEAHALSQYVRRTLSVRQQDELLQRTRQWHVWDSARPGRSPAAAVDVADELTDYEPCCPLLVDHACIAYPVRPLVCRTHFVSSPAIRCLSIVDPEVTTRPPLAIHAALEAARPFVDALRQHVESTGADSSRSMMLLPHWLASQMGWQLPTPTDATPA